VAMPTGAVADVWPGYAGIFIRHPREAQQGNGVAPWREAMAGSFGLIPHWAKDPSLAKKTYNARSETVASKPSYRDAWRLGRRCIIPAEAFMNLIGDQAGQCTRASLAPMASQWGLRVSGQAGGHPTAPLCAA